MARKLNDITGQKFNKLTVIRYSKNKLWECKCDCGNIVYATSTELKQGRKKSCGCIKRVNLEGQRFGRLTALKYAGNKQWECLCDCGNITKVNTSSLISGDTKSCGCINTEKIDNLIGRRFDSLVAKEYLKGGKWRCVCDCGEEVIKYRFELIDKIGTKCSHIHKYDSINIGDTFGELTVINKDKEHIMCKCSCGNIKTYNAYLLLNGKVKSCGHKTKFKDLTGMIINDIKVLRYIGDRYWECECSCGKIFIAHGYNLGMGYRIDCGHSISEKRKSTLMEKYGDISINRDRPRELWQIQAVSSKENLLGIIEEHEFKKGSKISQLELSDILDITPSAVGRYIKKFDLKYKLSRSESYKEAELIEEIRKMTDDIIHIHDKNLIKPYELDIYIPNKKIAIEFNGNYWHSNIFKDKKYHQNKTIQCIKNGIHLIHVFEYEWDDKDIRYKILSYIKSKLSNDKNRVYAKDCNIHVATTEECKYFLEKYHMQGYTPASFNYKLTFEDKIIAVMTFGYNRFTDGIELIRYCTDGTNIVGGFARLLSKFITEHKPNNIVSYCDLTKFKGDVYFKNGFTASISDLTEPNYKWVSKYNTLSRYQTQKHILIENGLGAYGSTEDEIMENIGFVKVYNSGNMRFTWFKG